MNQSASIYQDMATRTGSSIYIGVVGPVRTGKSTFIKRFMETQVLPNIDDSYRRDRARDELPQSGSGRTIMTAEPKFVPEEAVEVCMEEGVTESLQLPKRRSFNEHFVKCYRFLGFFIYRAKISQKSIKNQ